MNKTAKKNSIRIYNDGYGHYNSYLTKLSLYVPSYDGHCLCEFIEYGKDKKDAIESLKLLVKKVSKTFEMVDFTNTTEIKVDE